MTCNAPLPWSSEYEEYLRDESRRRGSADSISFPRTEADVVETIRTARENGVTVTVQGARTGLVAGAVPQGGHILNLSRMNGIGDILYEGTSGKPRLRVQPGALLTDVHKTVKSAGLFFPPDPTETSASIGGMAACNASGSLTYHYGPTRNWIDGLRVVLADGSALDLRRGLNRASGREFSLKTEDGRIIEGCLPSYTMPNVKSAAGYYAVDDMDMIDLFIGMEGTLGIITEIELKLIPEPKSIAGLVVFLPDEESSLYFVRALRGEQVDGIQPVSTKPVAIEFFNHNALNLLRDMKSRYPAFSNIPALKPHFHTAVYIEFHAEDQDTLDEIVMEVMEVMQSLGASDEDAWCATSYRELEPIKAFRHATPEAVNLLIDERKKRIPELTKLGTDMSVPDSELISTMAMYREGLDQSGLESVIFGHIGNNHVHVNILPNTMDEYEKGKELYLSWACRVIEVGGSVSAEHGIGKIKAPFLKLMYGEEGIAEMQALRRLFDPDSVLNVGNLF